MKLIPFFLTAGHPVHCSYCQHRIQQGDRCYQTTEREDLTFCSRHCADQYKKKHRRRKRVIRIHGCDCDLPENARMRKEYIFKSRRSVETFVVQFGNAVGILNCKDGFLATMSYGTYAVFKNLIRTAERDR